MKCLSGGTVAEHSRNILRRGNGRTFPSFLGARVVTVYSAKMVIECDIIERDMFYSICSCDIFGILFYFLSSTKPDNYSRKCNNLQQFF